MKKLIALLLSLCLVLSLAGCGAVEEIVGEVTKDTKIQKEGFSIILPAYAVDSSEEPDAATEPYVFVVGDIVVCAMEQYKEDFGTDMTAEEYAQVLVDSNEFPGGVSVKNGVPTFTFHSDEDDLTYLCITRVTDNAFWFINAACRPEDFDENQDTMWSYLLSTEVYATGEAFVAETEPAYDPVVIEDLTIYMPPEYSDISDQAGDSFDFAFMPNGDTVVMGLREDKSTLDTTFEELDEYAQGLIEVNGLDVTLEHRDGMPYFIYTSDDGDFTYIGTVYEGENAYWFIQGYSYTDTFPQLEDTLWQFISTCTVE